MENQLEKLLELANLEVAKGLGLTKEEGEENVKKFLAQNKNFALEKIDLDIENNGFITFYPHILETDGFFAAKFKRID